MPKFFVYSDDINNNTVRISGDDFNHIKTVLRMKEGEELTVCDRKGTDYICRISSFEKDCLIAEICSSYKCVSEPEIKVTLFQGLPKFDKMELIIQKCVELGVFEIVPVKTERSISKIDKKDNKKIERWQKISEAAAKQSGRGIIPEISTPLSFEEAVKKAKELDFAIIPYENEKENKIKKIIKDFKGSSIGVFIGPEGGFSLKEIETAKNSGIIPITLGERILRTETAGMVTLAVLLYELEN